VTREDIVVTRWGARFMGRRFACSVGRRGIVAADAKREGDGATPAGIHRIVAVLFRPDRLTRPSQRARAIGPRDLWSDDPAAADYNHLVRLPYPHRHEVLRRADPIYDLVLVTGWNWPRAVPGKGSAIFIHTWRAPRHPTAGCVAFAPRDLRWIVQHLTPRTRLIVVG
jgi:L,D-peptidoglycan transpeptidase YkuD (ErfK/YbiS/YcfS/YnhG family)